MLHKSIVDVGGVPLWVSSDCGDTNLGLIWPQEWPFIKLGESRYTRRFFPANVSAHPTQPGAREE